MHADERALAFAKADAEVRVSRDVVVTWALDLQPGDGGADMRSEGFTRGSKADFRATASRRLREAVHDAAAVAESDGASLAARACRRMGMRRAA